MTNSARFWCGVAFFLGGMVVGFILSPMPKGISVSATNRVKAADSRDADEVALLYKLDGIEEQ